MNNGCPKLSIDGLIEQFVEDLEFDVLVIWADILKVGHDEELWLDDIWPEKENELRTEVAQAMMDVGSRLETLQKMKKIEKEQENEFNGETRPINRTN